MRFGKIRSSLIVAVGLAVLATVSGCGGNASAPTGQESTSQVTLEEKMIPSSEAGAQLYLRHKYLTSQKTVDDNHVVLFLEPFSVPTAMAFDVPGMSWMEPYAEEGYDTWALDFRGFGKSTRPAEMNEPATQNKPVIHVQDSVEDLATAVDYIKKTRGVDKIDIVGWSYGSVVAADYAGLNPNNVNRLVLTGFMNGFNEPFMADPYAVKGNPMELNPDLPAYQAVPWSMAMMHWDIEMGKNQWTLPDAMEKVGEVYTASDPAAQTSADHSVRRPMGPLVDLYYIWTNRPLYSLSKITAPTLVIRGSADFMSEPNVLKKLTGTKVKQEVVIQDATHWVLYEKNRDQLIDKTKTFLDGH
ncbi:MAG TPA: alpha/beta hydrolase [Pseudonocardiaceae bacterium]